MSEENYRNLSEENYRNLSEQLADFRADMGARFEKVEKGQTALQISVAKILTWQKALTAGIAIAIGIAIFLHNEQNARITRVQADLNARITRVEERIVSRLEAVFANLPNTTCQCDETKANDE